MAITVLKFVLFCSIILSISSVQIDTSNTLYSLLESQMDKSPKEIFKSWHLLFKKEYTLDSSEAKQRFKTFKENLIKIRDSNAKNLSFKVGLNQFSDLTNEEFKAKYATLKPGDKALDFFNEKPANQLFMSDEEDDDLTKRNLQSTYPAIDYRGFFDIPRDQGGCGSCWAFTTCSAIEGGVSKKLGKIIPYLSPQQMVDCSTANAGCRGGSLRQGMNYALQFGLQYDSDYVYKDYQQSCAYNNLKPLTRITSWDYCCNYSAFPTRYCSFDKVYKMLAKGPLSVSVDGGTWDFQTYASGIFNSSCTQVNHAVTLVGYGVSNNIQYWLVRNSWGTTWGEKGNIRIQVNPGNNNSCFIEYEAVLPQM